MPIVYMKIFPDGVIKDREGKPLPDADISVGEVVRRIQDHPIWVTGRNAVVLAEIVKAWERRDRGWWCMSADDHKVFADALSDPKRVAGDMVTVMPGLGWHPRFVVQVEPYVQCCLKTYDAPIYDDEIDDEEAVA